MGWRDIFKKQGVIEQDTSPLPDGKFAPILRDSGPSPSYVTIAMNELLSIGMAAATYHGITRDDENYAINVGSGLAQRYIEEPRSRMQFYRTVSVLMNHCEPAMTETFLAMTRDAGFDHNMELAADGSLRGPREALIVNGVMDMYVIGQHAAAQPGFAIEHAPFAGPARRWYDCGYRNVPLDDPEAIAARDTYVRFAVA